MEEKSGVSNSSFSFKVKRWLKKYFWEGKK